MFGLFAMSLDLLVGFCRLYSFGHAAAYGVGAYSYALILTHAHLPLPAGILLAVAVTVAAAVPIAWICTRSTGVSFAMLTLAFAQLGYAMLFRFRDVTGRSAWTGSRERSATTIWSSAACSARISCAARSCARRSAPCSPASARTRRR